MTEEEEPGQVRLQQLVDNLSQDLDLLKQYEDALRYEDDPRRRGKFQRDIKQLQASKDRYQKEYDDLKSRMAVNPPPQLENVRSQIGDMRKKLDSIASDQEDISKRFDDLQRPLIVRFDPGQQTVVSELLGELNQRELKNLRLVLDGIEKGRLSTIEIQNTLTAVKHALDGFLKRPPDSIASDKVGQLSQMIDSPKLNLKNKLKLAVPIIPFVLSYEAELGLNGDLNLSKAWKRLIRSSTLFSWWHVIIIAIVLLEVVAVLVSLPACVPTRVGFSELFFNLDQWKAPSSWGIRKESDASSNGRLYVENSPELGLAKKVCYDTFSMGFHLKLENEGGAAWALRIKDSSNYYLFYLSGPQGLFPNTFCTYIVRDNRFDRSNPLIPTPVIPKLVAGGQYQIEITADASSINHKIIPASDSDEHNLGNFTDPNNLFSSGSIGFRTVGSEKFSVDNIFVEPLKPQP